MNKNYIPEKILDSIFARNGVEGLPVIDSHPYESWESIRVQDEVYPRLQLRAVQEVESGLFYIQDETGWDGYEEYPPLLLTSHEFSTYDEARNAMTEVMALYKNL